ncbi:unnamed protein product [Rotaria sp. Silwood2]|nr:unnamed protein product [Rotaria sp. Silwood2]
MTKLDFYRLIGFLFYGSLVRLPCKSDYWTATCGLETVTKSITRDRVDELLRSLHFNDNVLQVHVIDKIQPLINLFNDQCGSIVNPEKIISVDEQMVGYKGKSAPKSLKQYMPQKPTQRGFKFCTNNIFIITSSNNYQFICSTRSSFQNDDNQEKLAKRYDDIKLVDKSGMVVIDLLDNVPKGSHIFVDNYFASLKLLDYMTALGYGLTCILRSNRIGNCPIESEKSMLKQPRGHYDYLVSSDKKMIIVGWQDNRRVLIASNVIGIEPIAQLSRWVKKHRKKNYIYAP